MLSKTNSFYEFRKYMKQSLLCYTVDKFNGEYVLFRCTMLRMCIAVYKVTVG
jgi:hypothetical protein